MLNGVLGREVAEAGWSAHPKRQRNKILALLLDAFSDDGGVEGA